ncbi:MAG TPA: symmetrical bis(5'-nucleosyl)-tetraphosphatase [Pseudidiomarina sp.]|nr:symmetrical bis(5'-nucleosyl)-tetraphosphatase [Pseudidiomarina sp.]
MARYLVGDIQGCRLELECLLDRVGFNPRHDELWCVGDLVARGPDSLGCWTLIRELGTSFKMTLGNHDLNLLAILLGQREANPKDRLAPLLNLPAAERDTLIEWLCQQPLLRHDYDCAMSHAGIYPWWTTTQAATYAREVEKLLRDASAAELKTFLADMYGDSPTTWRHDLAGAERYRFIINAFTRMRFCTSDGALDLKAKMAPSAGNKPEHLIPWFELWPVTEQTLVFGHWAALMGETGRDDVIGLDTGCVWGEHLTLMRWPERRFEQQSALPPEAS